MDLNVFLPWVRLEEDQLKDILGPGYTTDHEVGPWKMAFVNGPSSWSDFHGPTSWSLKSLGPLTRCKPNVDQEE
jgi:hypothetical protein